MDLTELIEERKADRLLHEALVMEKKWWEEELANSNTPDATERAKRRITQIEGKLQAGL